MRSEQHLTRRALRARRARRRLLTVTTACAGVALGIVATTGVTAVLPISAPQAAHASSAFATTMAATPVAAAPAVGAFGDIAADAETALGEADTALAQATAVTDEVAQSGLDLGGADTTIATAALSEVAERLEQHELLPALIVPSLTDEVANKTQAVTGQVAGVRDSLNTARAAKAEADAAAEAERQAEAAAAAEAQREAESAAALAAVNTPSGAKRVAQQMASEQYGWGEGQFSCLVSLWEKESSWNHQAYNASSGATGIPQALPGSKMASAGADWQTNAATQIAWGLDYISAVYGTPCAAWGHSQSTDWY